MREDTVPSTHEEHIAALEGTWEATSRLLHGRPEADWTRPTGCPGWTVKDQLSHMVWSARILGGKTPPDIDLPELDHVRSEVAAYMELDVHARRPVPGEEVLAEFDEERVRGIADLRRRLPDGFEEPFSGPMGRTVTRSRWVPVSTFDQWVHGEDIRAALGEPGDLCSPAAEVAYSFITARLARVSDSVVVRFTGPGERTLRTGEGTPSATITLSASDFVTLAAGRARPTREPEIDGDAEVAGSVLAAFPLTP